MIKIRYADLPGGLHVRVVASGKDTIIYLLPGLTTLQRRAALSRAQSSARMGQGPRLSSAGVMCAVTADRIRTTVRNAATATRMHPVIFVPPLVIIVSAAIAYVLLVSVSIKIHSPQAGGPGLDNPIAAAIAPPPESTRRGPAQPTRQAVPGRSGQQAQSPPGSGHHTAAASPSPSPGPSQTAPGPGPSPVPTTEPPTPSTSPTPDPGGSDVGGSDFGGFNAGGADGGVDAPG